MEKKVLKSGDVVGKVSKEILADFRSIERQKRAAWDILENFQEERGKLWKQISKDLKMSNDYVYTFNRYSGTVSVIRETSISEKKQYQELMEEAK